MTSPQTSPPRTYTVGTLSYTKGGLATVFLWLLWGDFTFTLLETVIPSLLPLLLKQYGANNREIAVIVGTVASLLNCIITPVVSFRSDRYRSRWGRRIPFLAWPTPLIAICLALIPFTPELTRGLLGFRSIASLLSLSPVTPLILMFGVVTVCFQLFNMVVNSVYYYLFKDVVPERFLGRFMSLFRVCGALSTFVFRYFIFGGAETHMKEIFVGVGVIYAVSFVLMCWRVKEGEYPPPPTVDQGPGWWPGVQTYFKECFQEPFYLWVYAVYTLWMTSSTASMFAIFFFRDELKLSLDEVGKLGSWPMLACLPLAYPLGVLVDRWKAQRIVMVTTSLSSLCYVGCFLFVRDRMTFIISIWVAGMVVFLSSIGHSIWIQTILPQDRFGQFASASALISALVSIVAAPLCGLLFDWLKVYRYWYLWYATFQFLAFLCLCRVYRYWKQYGGPDRYQPPL